MAVRAASNLTRGAVTTSTGLAKIAGTPAATSAATVTATVAAVTVRKGREAEYLLSSFFARRLILYCYWQYRLW